MNNITKKLYEENIELIEEAGELTNVIKLLLTYDNNPVDALTNFISTMEIKDDEDNKDVKVVNEILEGLKSEYTKDKANVLAKEFILKELREVISEVKEEHTEMMDGLKEYIDITKSNHNVLTSENVLEDILSNINVLPLARIEYLAKNIETYFETKIATDLTKQKSITKFITDYKDVLENIKCNLEPLVSTVDRSNSDDLLYATAKNMLKDENLSSEDVKALLNIEPLEPKEPAEIPDLIEVVLESDNPADNNDYYNTFMDTNRSIINRLKISNDIVKEYLDTVAKLNTEKVIDEVLINIESNFEKYLNNEINDQVILSEFYILQYVINSTTKVYNEVTRTSTNLNRNMGLVSQAYDINKTILGMANIL